MKLNGHIDPTLYVHKYAKPQPIAIPTSHVIAMFVPTSNKLLKCNICQLTHVHI